MLGWVGSLDWLPSAVPDVAVDPVSPPQLSVHATIVISTIEGGVLNMGEA